MTASTPPSPELLANALAAPLGTLRLPTRMQNFFERRGLVTVRDLVAYAPASLLLEPNLGRKSVADTRTVLRQKFKLSWEVLREAAGGGERPVRHSREPADEWSSFPTRLPSTVLESPVREAGLPARMQTFAARELIPSLAELLAMPYGELAEKRGIGTGTLREAIAHLRSLVPEPAGASAPPPDVLSTPAEPIDPLPPGSHWRALLTGSLRELAPRERLVVTQRSGLAGPPQTLAELGECLGFSRERARQLESRGLERIRAARWREPAAARLDARCPRPIQIAATTAGDDELFVFDDDDSDAFAFFVNDVLAGRTRAYRMEESLMLATATRESIEERLRSAREASRGLAYPFEWSERHSRIANALGGVIDEIVDLAPFLDDEWIVDGSVITGYGTTKRKAVIAFVRALGRPASRAEIEERFGRMPIPPPLMLVDYGTFGLPEQVPDWDRWRARVPPLVRSILERDGAHRQWSASELLPRLAEEADLPDWLNEWALGSLLRDVPDVRYLGRNVVALPEAAEERLHVDEVITAVLTEAGGPIDEDELVERVKRARGLGQHTWMLMRMRRPFLLFGDRRVGLAPRDVPGGESAIGAFVDRLYAVLDQRQRGLSAAELRPYVDVRAGWDLRLGRSLLRHDGRFRAAAGGSLGLAEWEDTRAPTQREILEELMEQHEGIVPVETAIAMVPSASGEPLTRERVGLLANSIRARLVGPCIEWMVERPDNDAMLPELTERAIAGMPEAAAGLFRSYVVRQRPVNELRTALEEWARVMRAEAQHAAFVEGAQVERVLRSATDLLNTLTTARGSDEVAVLCSAAISYVVAVDDAQTDTAVGGLDDDEAVLQTVCQLLLSSSAAQRESPPSPS